jgi:hypothetical protein
MTILLGVPKTPTVLYPLILFRYLDIHKFGMKNYEIFHKYIFHSVFRYIRQHNEYRNLSLSSSLIVEVLCFETESSEAVLSSKSPSTLVSASPHSHSPVSF